MNNEKSSQSAGVAGMMTLDELRQQVKKGEINQVVMSFPDMYGRLLGKTFDVEFFLESAAENGTHVSNSLLMCNMGMGFQLDYANISRVRPRADFHLLPAMNTLRLISCSSTICTT